MPNASGGPPAWPWLLPNLRHGSRTRDDERGGRSQSRACRHDAEVLDRPHSLPASLRLGNGWASFPPPRPDRATDVEFRAVRSFYALCALGRLAVFRTRRAVPRDPKSQHVHADRDGHWYRLGLQRYRDLGAGSFPAGFPERRRFGGDLL